MSARAFVQRSKPALLTAAALVCVGAPGAARAYSDPERFTLDSTGGGGGGRYFTGSPVDGYGCKVCHDSEQVTAPSVSVRGLPVDTGYTPGTVYDVEISWPPGTPSVGAQLEMIGRDGRGAGMLSLPDESTLPAAAHCGGVADEAVASYIVDDGERMIVGLKSCQAGLLRFRFTAPSSGDVSFSGGLVSSDESASAQGDGFVSLNRVLFRADQTQRSSAASCTLTRSPSSSAGTSGALFVLVALAWRVRRRQRKVSPSRPVSSSA